jgi:Domain of unknown function (DUF4118)
MWPRGSGSWDRLALALAALAPFAVSAVLVPFRDDFDNTQIALVLVVVVVAVAAYGNRTAGYLAALSAGLWFDFFFTRPYQRFTITDRSDIETFVLLLLVGIAVTELAVWGRRQQMLASREAGYLAGIHAAAESGAVGGSSSAWSRRSRTSWSTRSGFAHAASSAGWRAWAIHRGCGATGRSCGTEQSGTSSDKACPPTVTSSC